MTTSTTIRKLALFLGFIPACIIIFYLLFIGLMTFRFTVIDIKCPNSTNNNRYTIKKTIKQESFIYQYDREITYALDDLSFRLSSNSFYSNNLAADIKNKRDLELYECIKDQYKVQFPSNSSGQININNVNKAYFNAKFTTAKKYKVNEILEIFKDIKIENDKIILLTPQVETETIFASTSYQLVQNITSEKALVEIKNNFVKFKDSYTPRTQVEIENGLNMQLSDSYGLTGEVEQSKKDKVLQSMDLLNTDYYIKNLNFDQIKSENIYINSFTINTPFNQDITDLSTKLGIIKSEQIKEISISGDIKDKSILKNCHWCLSKNSVGNNEKLNDNISLINGGLNNNLNSDFVLYSKVDEKQDMILLLKP